MCDYFAFINHPENKARVLEETPSKTMLDDFDEEYEWKATELLIEKYCAENFLQVKAVKEIHYLSIQLEKMMKEELEGQLEEQQNLGRSFAETVFEQPSDSEEVVLQQAILAGLI
mmetsp:Transcript_2254/g.3888  ORF Transcript_2254/g.3888 Transcript_2254/m.3888 type:complete len:115 (+) Transcript_2254:367-711(+)